MAFARKYIGDKKFYRMLMAVALPIILQNGITNFVSMIDNIMIGRVEIDSTEQMTGVSIVNQLMFVFNISIFGMISGAGIFGAQFYGKGDEEGVRYTFRFKLILCTLFTLLAMGVFWFFGESLISLFLNEGSETGDIEKTLYYAKGYLMVMLIQMIPSAITQAYASTLRERGETVVPMVAGVTAVIINVCLNAVLIFGLLGAPALGVVGAAIATCIAKFIELLIVVIWTHRHSADNQFIIGAFRSFYIPKHLVGRIVIKGTPLMLNEALWATGTAFLVQCYSERGLAVVTAVNIANTLTNLFNIIFISIGSAISIIIGQLLGAGKMKEAKDTDNKLIFAAVASCAALGVVAILIAPLFPLIYRTADEVRDLAESFIIIGGIFMPVWAFLNSAYFTIRTGGKTFITFLFDSAFIWSISAPIAYYLSRHTNLGIVSIYFICQAADIIKCIIGFILLKKGIWLNNIVDDAKGEMN